MRPFLSVWEIVFFPSPPSRQAMSESQTLLCSSKTTVHRANGYQSIPQSALSSSPTSFHTTNDVHYGFPPTGEDMHNQNIPNAYHHRTQLKRSGSSDTLDGSKCCTEDICDDFAGKSDSEYEYQEEREALLNARKLPDHTYNKPSCRHWCEYLTDIFEKYSSSLYLENTGSVARDHLGKTDFSVTIRFTLYWSRVASQRENFPGVAQDQSVHDISGRRYVR